MQPTYEELSMIIDGYRLKIEQLETALKDALAQKAQLERQIEAGKEAQ